MRKLLATLRPYFIPILMFGIALVTLIGDPNKPILSTVPIIPGAYQGEIAAGFLVFGLFLALIIYRYEKRKHSGLQ